MPQMLQHNSWGNNTILLIHPHKLAIVTECLSVYMPQMLQCYSWYESTTSTPTTSTESIHSWHSMSRQLHPLTWPAKTGFCRTLAPLYQTSELSAFLIWKEETALIFLETRSTALLWLITSIYCFSKFWKNMYITGIISWILHLGHSVLIGRNIIYWIKRHTLIVSILFWG